MCCEPRSWRTERPRVMSFDTSEALDDALAHRLERLVPGAAQGGVDACALGRAVVDGDEHRDLTMLRGEGGGHVGAPHRVYGLGDDRAVVIVRAVGPAHPARRRQAVLVHQAAHPLLGRVQAGVAQPRPDLAVALSVKGAVGEHPPDRLDQSSVRHRARRPRPLPWRRRRGGSAAQPVDARARDAPDAADPGDTVAAACGGRDDGAHRAGACAAKGAPASSRSTFV